MVEEVGEVGEGGEVEEDKEVEEVEEVEEDKEVEEVEEDKEVEEVGAVMPGTRTPAARSFRDLLVWRKAHQFVLATYSFTAAFPKQEVYGLAVQMRRAAISIPANIAEGFRRRGKADKARFMNLAEGSVEESRYYLILANDLKYGDTSDLVKSLEEVSRVFSTPMQPQFDDRIPTPDSPTSLSSSTSLSSDSRPYPPGLRRCQSVCF